MKKFSSPKEGNSKGPALSERSESNGFSMVEIVLVVMIVGFIVLLLFNLPSSIGLIGFSRHESQAKNIVSKKIEDLRARGYQNLASGAFNDSGLISLPSGIGNVLVEDCPDTICIRDEEIKKITVSVSWMEKELKKAEVITFIGEGGIK